MKGSLFFTLLLAVLVGLLLWVALSYPIDVRVVPFVVGFPTLFLLAILLVGEFVPQAMKWMDSALDDLWGGRARGSGMEAGASEATGWGSVLRIIGWALIFFAAVFFLGLFLVPPVFIVAFLIIEAGVRPRQAFLMAVLSCVLLYGGMNLLRVDLWTGAIPDVIPNYLGGSIIPPV